MHAFTRLQLQGAQTAVAVKYTDYISAEGWDSPNICSGYDS